MSEILWWMIIQLLRTEPVLKVALFVLEEKVSEDIPGCRGARACDLSFFDDARYITTTPTPMKNTPSSPNSLTLSTLYKKY